MPGLRDLHVLAKADTQRERIAIEVRQKTRQRSSRGVGLHRRPLASQAHDLSCEGLQGLSIEGGPRNERLVGAIHLEHVGTAQGDAHHEPDDACAADDARRPLIFEASANLVEPNDAAETVEHSIQRGAKVAEDGEVEAFEALRQVDADLRLALAEVVSDLSLRLGVAGDSDRALDRDALGITERPRCKIPQAIERVSAVVAAGAVRAELVERLDDVRQLLPADPWQLQQLGAGQRCHCADRRQIGLGERGAERVTEGELLHWLGRIAQIRNEGWLGSCRRGGGSGNTSPEQRLLERDDVVGGLGADRVDGAHLRGRQSEQLAHRVHLAARERVDRSSRQASESQGRCRVELRRGRNGRRRGHVLAEGDEQCVSHRARRREALLGRGVERLAEERAEARRLDVVVANGRRLPGLRDSPLEGVAAGVELEQAERSGEAIGQMRPARARGIAVERGPTVGRVLGHRREAEVDDGEPAIADEEVLGLQVLVGDRLLLEVVEACEQVFGEPALRGRFRGGMERHPLAQRLPSNALHHEREAPLDHLGEIDDAHDVGMVESREHLVLAAQRLLCGVLGARDLERARATADEVARGVDDGHPALAQARHHFVVGADARARLEVVGVEGYATDVRERALRARRGISPQAHGLDGLGERREAVGGSQLDHASNRLVEAQGDALGDVAHPAHQATRGHQLASALEERLAGEQQREHRAEAELVGRWLCAAEGRDDLGRSEDQAIVSDGGEGDGGVARELLRQIEPRHANLRRLLLVLDQDDFRSKEAMHDALPVRLVERLRDAHPEVGAHTQVGLLFAASVGTVAFHPRGERDALEVLERQHDACLVRERRIGTEHAFAAAQPTEDLRLPAGALRHAVALCAGGEWGDAVDAQHPLGRRETVLAEQLGERVLMIERLDDLVLADATDGLRATLRTRKELEQLALRERRRSPRAALAQALDERRVLEGREDGLPRVNAVVAGGSTDADVCRGREKDEPLGPDLAGLIARVLEVSLQDLRGHAIELQRAADLLRQPPVVVGPLDTATVGLDLDDEDRERRDDDRVELEDDTAALHEPGVPVDRVVRGQALDEEPERLSFRVMRGLSDGDELGGHGHTNSTFAVGNQIASWSSTRKRPPLSG